MKIAVFSDLHGNYQAAKVILEDIKNNNYDEVICLGDTIGIGPRSKDTIELVLNSKVDNVLGNHDLYYVKGLGVDDEITNDELIMHHKWIHESIKEIPREKLNFPLSKEMNINSKKLVFQHYILSKDTSVDPYPFETFTIKDMDKIKEYCKNMDCDYLIIGHEHDGFEVHENNKNIICVGSSGCVKTNKTFYTIIDTDNNDINITKKEIEFDTDGFINDVKANKYPLRDFISKELYGIEKL